jgi:hypothetical protein
MIGSNGSRKRWQIWLVPLGILGGCTALVFFSFFILDWHHASQSAVRADPIRQLFNFDPDTLQNALGNLAQVIAAILGIVITVVSIIVQLAATRYTPRVADMFFRDRTNLAVLGFFVIAGIDAVWLSTAVTHSFVPRTSVFVCLVMVSFSILLMVPYFAYVFDFLDPEKVVARIQEQALASAIRSEAAKEGAPERQPRVLQAIEQLADVAMNAVSQKDKLIAQGAVDALKELAVRYLERKGQTAASWFTLGAQLRQNPDFVSMSRESIDRLEHGRIWMEWKVLRQYQALYNESLGQLSDMNHLLGINTRYIGEAAISAGDDEALKLSVKFFNTYLRATLNAQEVRPAFIVLNQYRQLCEKVIFEGTERHNALAVEIAGYFRYYGQIAHGMRLRFISETVAYDLESLCEHAWSLGAACHDTLLRVLLTLDQNAETGDQELMLRGVRKAQVKLATFYLSVGAEEHARVIAADMKDEPASRLASIRDELIGVLTADFWEVIDRGSNFDYLDETRKAQLQRFFEWFPTLAPPSASGAQS